MESELVIPSEHFNRQLTEDEIAELFECSRERINFVVKRALKKLREQLESERESLV